jgi:hypothetical protein
MGNSMGTSISLSTEEARRAVELGLLVKAQRLVKLVGLRGLVAEDGEGEAHRTAAKLEEW